MDTAHNHLMLAHAFLEVAWRPVRRLFMEPKKAPIVFAARRAGLRLPSFANDQRGWKRDQLERDRLISQGLWSKGTLTAAGKRLVRAWTWGTDRDDLLKVADRIRECVRRGWCRDDAAWVPESIIAGYPWGGCSDPFIDLEFCLVPALIDGWIESASTCQGHAFYRLVDLDVDFAAAAAESMPEELLFRNDYLDKYIEHAQQLRKMLLAGSLNINPSGEIGEIPLPVGAPLVNAAKNYDPAPEFGPLFPRAEAAADA
jgi:hypothetical protein